MVEVVDIGRLIECIQERTFLWDEKNNHYRDRKARDMAWMEIGDEMYDNWSQLSRSEKAEKANTIKNKWRHLRDNFLRSLKGGNDYVYTDCLYFLRDSFRENAPSKRKKNASVFYKVQKSGHEASDNSSSKSILPPTSLQNSNNRLSNIQPSISEETTNSSFSNSFQNTKELLTVQPILSHKTSKKVEGCPKEENAAEKLFFVSILRDFKKLNRDEKLEFRIMCLQHLLDAKKKRKAQNHTSFVSPSQQQHSEPEQITPD